MKVCDLLVEAEQELLSRSENKADTIGQQILRKAQEEAYRQRRPNDVEFIRGLANKMVNNFSSNILAAIDDELKFSQMDQIGR